MHSLSLTHIKGQKVICECFWRSADFSVLIRSSCKQIIDVEGIYMKVKMYKHIRFTSIANYFFFDSTATRSLFQLSTFNNFLNELNCNCKP